MHMVLVKTNIEKKRRVFKLSNCYRKEWDYYDQHWLSHFVDYINKANPNYLLRWGHTETSMWIEVSSIDGTPANMFDHTPEFVERIVNFCKENYRQTFPYAHGDWVLSNIIINDSIQLCDWDNIGIYPEHKVWKKMKKDLKSAFGDKFDSSSI